MSGSLSPDRELTEIFLGQIPLVDVRAPVEFAQGHAPGAVNLPLLNDEERAAVGTTYKHQGQDAAIALGHRYLSGTVREDRIASWVRFFEEHPEGQLYCFRGGLRSRSVRDALAEAGVRVPLIEGGYKRIRSFLIQTLKHASATERFAVITGFTGAGKTRLLRDLSSRYRVSHLEDHARHRGSAFGRWPGAQPSQANFENLLAAELIQLQGRQGPILIEDESRMIGTVVVPDELGAAMMKAPLFVVESSVEDRAGELIDIYLRENFGLVPGQPEKGDYDSLSRDTLRSLDLISKRIGGLETKRLGDMFTQAVQEQKRTGDFFVHIEWVSRLLELYYDPAYLRHLDREAERIVWRGPGNELATALDSFQTLSGR